MSSSRRDFLQRSTMAAAAVTLGPVLNDAHAVTSVAEPAPSDNLSVRQFEAKMLRAHPVPLANVRLRGGPLKTAQDATVTYLLALEPDRMMAYYRSRAGLKPKGEPYDGWDGDGRNLTGHIAGHHLSAVSLMYAATGDARFKDRADYLVRELKEVQDKHGDGFLSALAGVREAFARASRGDIRSGGFDLNGLWSPWYTLHKTYAGLRDAYRFVGNRTALELETRYATWAEGVLRPMTDAQVQKMLLTEHGGMNEVLADLYADTGDRRWLDLSRRFEHHAFTEPLKRGQDNLSGKHGNCQIPKLIGSAARYGYSGDADDILAAAFFWDRVVFHHSYATGGHGLAEYFGAPDQLSPRVDGRTCESCNVYNMLKLSRRLFSLRPDAMYADFHERALFNHALASLDPETVRMSYMVPVGRGVQQEYQDMQHDFTCCVGTGMENHALHGYGLYYESGEHANPTLWVNLFAPSNAHFPLSNMDLAMDTSFPDGDAATITLRPASPRELTVAVRRPTWAGDGFAITVNGENVPQPPLATLYDPAAGGRGGAPGNEAALMSSTYVELRRTWKPGDTVRVTLPKSVRLEPTPDHRSVAAIMWGPLVLAGNLGPRHSGRGAPDAPVPVLVAAERPLNEWIVPNDSRAGDFTARGVARVPAAASPTGDVALAPFYRTHGRTYSVYFDVLTPGEFDAKSAAIAAARERERRIEAATVGEVRIGEMTSERERNYQSEPANRPVQGAGGRASRSGTGWFQFDLPVDSTTEMAVAVTYLNELGLPPAPGDFDILVDGTRIGHYSPNAMATGFFDVIYPVPPSLVQAKSTVSVRFQAAANGRIAPIFVVRTIRAKEI